MSHFENFSLERTLRLENNEIYSVNGVRITGSEMFSKTQRQINGFADNDYN